MSRYKSINRKEDNILKVYPKIMVIFYICLTVVQNYIREQHCCYFIIVY